jgi:adenine-specific DNA-methyltransferase
LTQKYKELSKEQLVEIIERLKDQKKYGIVWEEEKIREIFESDSDNAISILKQISSKEIRKDEQLPWNIMIEGDNYHSLSVLNYTHESKIDLIYIDPPYNTGAKNWKYNNDYVDESDTYRHSKWLSMMSKRLRLAKNLLTENGVLICAIDENEVTRLGLLLEEIFSSKEIHLITIVHNPRGIQGKNFSYTNEFAYFVLPKNKKIIQNRKIDAENIDWRNLRDNGGESLRQDAKNCFYPIIVEDEKIIGFGDVCETEFHPKKQSIKDDNKYYIYPIDRNKVERKWRYARQSVESILKLLRVKKNKDNYEIEIGKDFGTYPTVWQNAKYDSNEYGKKIIGTLVPNSSFDYPKSVYNVYDCLHSVVGSNKNAVVLDFFAGSGTTAHAVLMLNKSDGGRRQFILCTNNENEIAETVCYPRIKSVIFGNLSYPEITGIKANLKYYKTSFVKKTLNKDLLKIRVTQECTEMLCMNEKIYDEIKKTDDFRIFKNNNRFMGIYYSLDYAKLDFLKIELSKLIGEKILYCFTLDPLGLDKNDFEDWINVELKDVPQKILDIYEIINEY